MYEIMGANRWAIYLSEYIYSTVYVGIVITVFSMFNFAVDSKLFKKTSADTYWAFIMMGWCHAHSGLVNLFAGIFRTPAMAAIGVAPPLSLLPHSTPQPPILQLCAASLHITL